MLEQKLPTNSDTDAGLTRSFVETRQQRNVAVLLATYNGAQFVEAQIKSLKENVIQFTLHWLDDQSTDDTREIVRDLTRGIGIELREWHQSEYLGIQRSYYRLLECVEADIYLFCDQDDIWQPGKIDATVENLFPDLTSPVLCFSNSIIFADDESEKPRRLYNINKKTGALSLPQKGQLFQPGVYGHTQGFTRPLRDIFVRHAAIAHDQAPLHDAWLYIIAVASGGTARILPADAPVALWRQHENSHTTKLVARGSGKDAKEVKHVKLAGSLPFSGIQKWGLIQVMRSQLSGHAKCFIAVAPTFPRIPQLTQALDLAHIVARLDRRQSPAALFRLLRQGVIGKYWVMWWLLVLFLSVAPPLDPKRDFAPLEK